MKIYTLSFILSCITFCLISCTKKDAREIPNPPSQNHAPVANAGTDQTISLENSIATTLDGSGSTDTDNNIKTYLWTKISGPSSSTIVLPANKQTPVTDLREGTYEFELSVTDAAGLSSKDRMQVSVKASSGCLLPGAMQVGNISEVATLPASVVCNDKIYFATRTEMSIYDPVSDSIAIEKAPINREGVEAISVGNTIFFAGGYNYYVAGAKADAKIDIYNTVTKTWTGAQLSVPRYYVSTSSVGDKVFFAGGHSDVAGAGSKVDIYDISDNSWSNRELSSSGGHVSVTVNNEVWFIALGSKKIDTYDATTDKWSTKAMDFYIYNYDFVVKQNHKAITLNNKIYFTGNQLVWIYDIASDTWSSITLREDKVFIPAGISNNKIAFIGGMTTWFIYSKLIEIYDPATNSWSTQYMSSDLFYESIISHDNYIYSAGGLADEEMINVTSICRFQL